MIVGLIFAGWLMHKSFPSRRASTLEVCVSIIVIFRYQICVCTIRYSICTLVFILGSIRNPVMWFCGWKSLSFAVPSIEYAVSSITIPCPVMMYKSSAKMLSDNLLINFWWVLGNGAVLEPHTLFVKPFIYLSIFLKKIDVCCPGDVEHTHLVKGLDYALLNKVRSEIDKKPDAGDDTDGKSR